MKLVDQYIDPNDAATARRSLRDAGVASHVDSMDPHSVLPSKSGATHLGLWVLLDDQYQDAVQVLENPSHRPVRILSPGEIDEIEACAEKQNKQARLKDAILAALLFACLLALIVFTALDFFLDI